MGKRFGSYGSAHRGLGRAAYATSRPLLRRYYSNRRLHQFDSSFARDCGCAIAQIVRPDEDPLTHAFLEAMGSRVGVEAAVNTSLDVGTPISQTAEHALNTLARARRMDGVVIVDEDGEARLIWAPEARPEAARERLAQWLEDQELEDLPDPEAVHPA